MKFVCANADLVQNINLDTDYDYITASSKSPIMAVETLANSFTKSKSDCVLFVWNTNDPSDLVRATEEACVENVNFKKIIDDLEKNLDYSILGDFDLESIELENGMTISVVKYVTMNNFVESKKSATKSIKESINGDCYIYYDDDDNKRLVFCDYVKGITDTRDWFYLNEYIIDAIHIFKNEKQAQKFIDEHLKYFADQDKVVIAEYPQTVGGFFESKKSARKSIKESSDVTDKIASEIDKSYWIDKLIDDLDKHYEAMEKAWLKNLDKLSDEDILGIVDDCMGKSKTLVGKSEMLKNKMIDDLSKAYDDYIDDIDRQIRIGKSEDEVKEMIETTLENDIKMYLKLAYNSKASSNYFMVKFAEDNLI